MTLAAPARGILFALIAYVSWGFLSPVGKILLESMEPFTLNAIRTILALPFLILLFGPRLTRAALHAVATDVHAWVLGAFWLGLTFVPYVWSLKYLPPTITTLTVYLAPLLVAAWDHFRLHEKPSPLVLPAVAATLVGGWLAIKGDTQLVLDGSTVTALVVAMVGVVGWSAYTVHLKFLTRTRDANVLTLAAFVTSAVAFTAGAMFEGFRVEWSPSTAFWLGLYVAFPTIISFWLYTLAVKRVSATTVAVFLGVELVATAIVSYTITNIQGAGESFTPAKIAGLGLTITAMTVYLWHENRRIQAERASASL